ncbi:septal ring lytic transglycosylase RlpA family protein [Alphaproteobacteria bacterium]|nr:septal ring lytic transglycosylase RlpA family protein [Alphaproteobacteria bacterium]MDC0148580.1 septal ring lytic transglycosylase RlpA family protein [Alphaproteobacteria bacterium]
MFQNTPKRRAAQALIVGLVSAFLASCGAPSKPTIYTSDTAAQGRQTAAGGIYKIGTPYKIENLWYYPQEDATYDNIGTASWYGAKFDGRRTANGEIFDMDLLTAAHPTLPMPVRARVTNLENGRSVVVRVNDRGPFAKDREIDMSRRAAEVLGFKEQGTARVRVQYLGRAPLFDSSGRLIRGKEPDRFFVEKPVTPADARQVAAAPIDRVEVQTTEGTAVAKPVLPITFADKRYAVQVGVFSDLDNANVLKQSLQTISPVEIVEVELNGAVYYRVKMGGANIRADARTTVEKLIAAGHQDAVIIEQ